MFFNKKFVGKFPARFPVCHLVLLQELPCIPLYLPWVVGPFWGQITRLMSVCENQGWEKKVFQFLPFS